MKKRIVRTSLLAVMLFVGIGFTALLSVSRAEADYTETIAVLKEAYAGELLAFHSYTAYARQARSESFPNIAYLFDTLAASEAVHAANFRTVLTELGGRVDDALPQFTVDYTKKNLRNASRVEIKEIDTKYPAFIERITPEKHEAALSYLQYAWQAEKQHRDLIQKIQSGTGIFFGILIKKIEEMPTQYFVCQNCGSTLTELPDQHCPICGTSVSNYHLLEKIELSPQNE